MMKNLTPMTEDFNQWYTDVIQEAEFFAHKQKMEKMYGPCEWNYVGKQTDIKNPAIPLKPPVGENYVLFRQVCENDPHRKD